MGATGMRTHPAGSRMPTMINGMGGLGCPDGHDGMVILHRHTVAQPCVARWSPATWLVAAEGGEARDPGFTSLPRHHTGRHGGHTMPRPARAVVVAAAPGTALRFRMLVAHSTHGGHTPAVPAALQPCKQLGPGAGQTPSWTLDRSGWWSCTGGSRHVGGPATMEAVGEAASNTIGAWQLTGTHRLHPS